MTIRLPTGSLGINTTYRPYRCQDCRDKLGITKEKIPWFCTLNCDECGKEFNT